MNTLRVVKAAKLHINQAMVLGYLYQQPGSTPAKVQTVVKGSRNLVSQLLKVMLERGYVRVESVQVPTGLRHFMPHYYLTDKGHNIANQFTYETTPSIPH